MITVYPNKPTFAPKQSSIMPPTSSRSLAVGALQTPSSPPEAFEPTLDHYGEIDYDFLLGMETTSMIVHVESVDAFFVQIREFSDKFGAMLSDLNEYYTNLKDSEYKLNEFSKDTPCVVEFSDDSVFYRAKVKNYSKQRSLLTVSFVDYGNEDILPAQEAKMLCRRFLNLPALAVKCKFVDFESLSVPNFTLNRYSEEFGKILKSLEGEKLTTIFRDRNRDGTWSVDMFEDNGMSIVKRFFSSRLAPFSVGIKQPLPTEDITSSIVPNPAPPLLSPVQTPSVGVGLSSISSLPLPSLNGCVSSSPSLPPQSPRFPDPDLSCAVNNNNNNDDHDNRYVKILAQIVRFVSLDQFYLTETELLPKLNKYECQLSDFYEKRKMTLTSLSPDELFSKIICVANQNGLWFRCEAVNLDATTTDSVNLHRVDYGDQILVPFSNVFPVIDDPRITETPRFAFCCSLKNVCTTPATNHKELKEEMEKICTRQCSIYGVDASGRFIVELFMKSGESMGSYFVRTGMLHHKIKYTYQYFPLKKSPPIDHVYVVQDAYVNLSHISSSTSAGLLSKPNTAVSSTMAIAANFGPLPIAGAQNSYIDIIVSHIEKPDCFYGRLAEYEAEFSKMQNELNVAYTRENCNYRPLINPKSGDYCACYYSKESLWYRCHVVERISPCALKVCFVDYGRTESLGLSDIRILADEFRHLPPLSIRFLLIDVPDSPTTTVKFIEWCLNRKVVARLDNINHGVGGFEVTLFSEKDESEINNRLKNIV